MTQEIPYEYGIAAIHEEQARIFETNKLQYLQLLKSKAIEIHTEYINQLTKY